MPGDTAGRSAGATSAVELFPGLNFYDMKRSECQYKKRFDILDS